MGNIMVPLKKFLSNKNTITINGMTVSLNSIDQKIDTLNSKIDNLSGLSWVEVLNINN